MPYSPSILVKIHLAAHIIKYTLCYIVYIYMPYCEAKQTAVQVAKYTLSIYMVTTYSRVWINRVRLPILLVVSWTGKNEYSPVPVPVLKFGLASRVQPSRPASACSFSILRLNLSMMHDIMYYQHNGTVWYVTSPRGFYFGIVQTSPSACREWKAAIAAKVPPIFFFVKTKVPPRAEAIEIVSRSGRC